MVGIIAVMPIRRHYHSPGGLSDLCLEGWGDPAEDAGVKVVDPSSFFVS